MVIENLAILFLVISTITTITSVIFLIRGINVVKQNEILEELIQEYENRNSQTEVVLKDMLDQMKQIDIKGSFESDDEVGYVFKQLKDLIESYTEEN
jgi:DNA gyrase/topoisomerase IV subunit A